MSLMPTNLRHISLNSTESLSTCPVVTRPCARQADTTYKTGHDTVSTGIEKAVQAGVLEHQLVTARP